MNIQAPPSLLSLARTTAETHGLAPSIVCAIIEQESGWNTWAVRFEPEFERRYIHPAHPTAPSTEELCLAMSWGLMQVMGKTAREHGFSEHFLNALCDPQVGLSVGCAVFAAKFTKAGGELERALLLWNGGMNVDYPGEVIARIPHYI